MMNRTYACMRAVMAVDRLCLHFKTPMAVCCRDCSDMSVEQFVRVCKNVVCLGTE